MSSTAVVPAVLTRLKTPALAVGVGGLALSVVLGFADAASFHRAWVLGYFLVLGLTLGSMGLLFIHHLVSGAWGFVIQRMLEAAARNIPLMLVLFIPILLGLYSEHPIYHWAEAGAAAHDELIAHKAPYLNKPFFVVRAAIYFAVWFFLIFLLDRFSYKQDQTGDGRYANRLGQMSGLGLVLYVFTMSFASFDWSMSLDPHWFSTIYGAIFIVGQFLSSMALMILVLPWARRNTELGEALTTDRLHDLGKLLLAFTCLWAYVNLSQFLIIWYGNLPEETVWYHYRTHGGYEYIAVALVFCQFVIPFLSLLSRWPKRSNRWSATIAGWILAVRYIDLYWYTMPHGTHGHVEPMQFHFVDIAAPVGMFALWFYVFLYNLDQRAILPQQDPRWKEKLQHAH